MGYQPVAEILQGPYPVDGPGLGFQRRNRLVNDDGAGGLEWIRPEQFTEEIDYQRDAIQTTPC